MSSLETYIAKNKGYCGMMPTTAEECEPLFDDVRAQLMDISLGDIPSDEEIADAPPNVVFLMNVWRDLEIICGGEQREIYI